MDKKKILKRILLLSVYAFFFTGCASTPVALRDYKPANPDEAAIISAIIAWEESFNNADQQKFLSIVADDARIMHGVQRKIFSKEEYVKILPERIKQMGIIKFSNPRIKIEQNFATVKAIYDGEVVVSMPYEFELKKIKGKWLIFSNAF